MRTLDGGLTGVFILIGIIAVTAIIALVAFIIYRRMHPKLKDEEEKKTENDYAREELDRILQPVEDEEAAEQISNYKDDEE